MSIFFRDSEHLASDGIVQETCGRGQKGKTEERGRENNIRYSSRKKLCSIVSIVIYVKTSRT